MTSYPNKDGDGNLFNWAVNPSGSRKRETEERGDLSLYFVAYLFGL